MKAMINKILDNEFHHIEEHHENNDLKDNKEIIAEQEQADKIFKELLSGLPEDKRKLLYEYDDAVTYLNVERERYYFRKGVAAGATDLDFMRDYTDML